MTARQFFVLTTVAPIALLFALGTPHLSAAEKDAPKKKAAAKKVAKEKKTARKVAKEKKTKAERKKARGRLPNFYRNVVDAKQKEKIYALQAAHKDKVAGLQAKIKELLKEMRKQKKQLDADVAAVLTEVQIEKVAELKKAAAAKRKK